MLKNLQNKLNENKGFSLVELIVVIAIMVILIALLVPNVIGYISKAQDSANLSAAKTIYNAANTACVDVKAKTGGWPNATELANVLNGNKADGTTDSNSGGALASVPKGTSAGIEYDDATGAVKSVWVVSGAAMPSSNDGKGNIQAYNPQNPGNAAVDSNGAAVNLPTFAVTSSNGADWA